MKYLLIVLILLSAHMLIAKSDKMSNKAIEKLKAASKEAPTMEINPQTNVPRFLKLKIATEASLNPEAASINFVNQFKEVFRMENPSEELVLKSVIPDRLGSTHVKFQQHVKGIPVFGHQLILHMDKEKNVYAINGEYIPDINLSNVTPGISAEAAIDIAKRKTGPSVYRWDSKFEETMPEGLSWYPQAQVMIYHKDKESRLVYRTMIAVEEPQKANWVYFIDAQTGEVVNHYNDLKTADATGTGHSLYRGQVGIDTNQKRKNSFEMIDNPRNIWTYDGRTKGKKALTLPGNLFTDRDNIWGQGRKSDNQIAAVDVHWGTAKTWDYFFDSFGRDGLDGQGSQVVSTVHYGNNVVNAYWDGQQMLYGDGDGIQSGPLVDLDVVAHELTHGITQHTADLIYQGQSGALNESMSDVFAMIIDADDYTIGEDSWTPGIAGDALRYMHDPTLGDQPKHMNGYVPNGGVHTNSGIPNHAAYLAVQAIGREKVGQIWYHALTTYMTQSTDFNGARSATVQAAVDLYSSTEVQSIENAWTAVGVVGTTSLASSSSNTVYGNDSNYGVINNLDRQAGLAPEEFDLEQNYPNPFNPTTSIRFALPEAEFVTLLIYSSNGQVVRSLVSQNMEAGNYTFQWNGANESGSKMSSGMYFYRITAGSFVQTKKMILMK